MVEDEEMENDRGSNPGQRLILVEKVIVLVEGKVQLLVFLFF
jgi:hypothetical protein